MASPAPAKPSAATEVSGPELPQWRIMSPDLTTPGRGAGDGGSVGPGASLSIQSPAAARSARSSRPVGRARSPSIVSQSSADGNARRQSRGSANGDDDDDANETGSGLAASSTTGLKADVKAFMAAQLRYAKHGVTKTAMGVQCDRILHESKVIDGFCRVAARFRDGFENFGDLRDWADTAVNVDDLVRAGVATPQTLMADFCIALKDFLELRGGYAAAGADEDLTELGDGLRESERAERLRAREARGDLTSGKPLFSSARQQIVKQAERISSLEDELRRTKARNLQQVAQIEAKNRETVRFETHRAVETAKAAMEFGGSDDTRQLKFENAALTNRVTTRDQEIERLKEAVVDLQQAHDNRELEIANLEVALMRVEAEKEHRKEDHMRESVSTTAKMDSEVAMLNSRIANFAETVMAYATQIRDMEVKHNSQLRRQKAMHEASVGDLSTMLTRARETLASRDAELTDLRQEYAKLSHRKAGRYASVAKSHAAFTDLTIASTSRKTIAPPKPKSVAELDAELEDNSTRTGSSSNASDGGKGTPTEQAIEAPFTPQRPPIAPSGASSARKHQSPSIKSASAIRQSALASRRASSIGSVQRTKLSLGGDGTSTRSGARLGESTSPKRMSASVRFA